MTDKVQKIREYLVGMAGATCCDAKTKKNIETIILPFIDSMQEEPISKDRLVFKAIPRLLEMLEPNDRAKAYTTRLADALEKEGYITDAKLAREGIKVMNGEKVAMATMDEEPVSEDLEDFALQYAGHHAPYDSCMQEVKEAVKAGAKWQKEKDQKK